MKKTNKLHGKILSFLLSIVLILTNINVAFANSNESNTIYIDSVDDWIRFSEKASLDTYFENKTVLLTTNIDLSDVEAFSVPTFAGVFNGQGNTISGISINKSGSVQGLFRYLGENAVVKNLNISGNIEPSGSRNIIGGLVGNNKGNIENCHFKGIVSGKNNIGGLVGINEAKGTISNCSSKGAISGEHYTGGIVGQNLGTVLKSINHSEVNTTVTEPTLNLEDINWSQINSTENIKAYTDTGGIAGFSSGYLQDCINRGPIGYKNIGYNVGGIVGRQSEYLSNCQNYNTVLGRKDIGGIVGQIEPYLMLVFSEDTLQKLDEELNILQNLLSNSFSNLQSSTSSISSGVDGIIDSVDKSKENMKILSKETIDHVDGVTDTINITSKRIRYTLEEIIPMLDKAEFSSLTLNKGIDDLESGFEQLSITSNKMGDALDESQKATKDLREAIYYGEEALNKIQNNLNDLLDNLDKKENINNIIWELGNAIGELENSFIKGSESVHIIINVIKNSDIDPAFINLYPQFKDLYEALNSISPTLSTLKKEIHYIIKDGISNFTQKTQNNIQDIFFDLESSSRNLDRSIIKLEKSFSKLEDTSYESEKAFNSFKNAFNKFGKSSETVTDIIVSTKNLLDSLASGPAIELPNISSEYRQSGENLFNNIEDISKGIKKINGEIKDTSENLNNNFQAVGNQIFLILNLIIDSRDQVGSSEYIEDNSDKNIHKNPLGAVYKNQNYGFVNGTVNIGGIAGAISIQYDLDPEDDIFKKGSPSLNFKYLTTAVLKKCINQGKVEGKKDYIGGIAGRMDLGFITECENYGDVESKEGDYVGGIAGASYTKIDKSFVLSALSGKDYIGGIAGYSNNIYNSYTLIQVKNGVEWIGSIAGEVSGEIANNYYVHDDIAAIDGISYSNKAVPLSYEELLKIENLPSAFKEFYITFISDGNIVKKIPFEYGDSFDFKKLPDIPLKSGHNSQWEDFDSDSMVFNTTVEAIYTPIKTVLSSNIMRNKDENLPLLLVEGSFNKDANLKIYPFDMANENFPIEKNKVLEAWNVKLENLEYEETDYSLRLLLPEAKGKIEVWQAKESGWKKINSSLNGSYIVFNMQGESSSFAIVENKFPWIFLLFSISILLLVSFFIRKFYNREKHEINMK